MDSRNSLTVGLNQDVYGEDHTYRQKRKGLYQFGIYNTGVRRYLPQEVEETGIVHEVVQTDTGYLVEMEIPLGQYLERPLTDYHPAIGFTVVVSDTDDQDNLQQETLMASSALKWGNPFSLGYLVFEIPTFPRYE